MKQNKKGFTLIELLAVIVILAIIALIAVPVIMNIINKARMSAFKDSAYGIISAGELYYAERLLEVDGMSEDVTFEFPNNIQGLGVKGDLPESGSMTITKEGKVALAISNGKYCVSKGLDDTDVTITEDVENCTLPGESGGNDGSNTEVSELLSLATTSTDLGVESVDACASSGTCNPGTAFAIKVNESETYKFYVLSDTETELTLMMDRNIYAEGNTTEPDVAWSAIPSGNTSNGPITALAALKTRTANWTNIPEKEYTYSDDGGGSKYSITRTMRARMIAYTEATALGCTADVESCPSWLLENLYDNGDDNTYGYWISAAHPDLSSSAWFMDNYARIGYSSISESSRYSVRPVITLSK